MRSIYIPLLRIMTKMNMNRQLDSTIIYWPGQRKTQVELHVVSKPKNLILKTCCYIRLGWTTILYGELDVEYVGYEIINKCIAHHV